ESDPDDVIDAAIAVELAELRRLATDDDSNGHVAFVAAASNLRCSNYRIPPASRLETKRIAGAIVPAIATTTAVVAGLACVELVKLAQDKPVTAHKNAFVNLARPFVAFSEPCEAERMPVRLAAPTASAGGDAARAALQRRDPPMASFTLWDRVMVPAASGLTVGGLIDFLKREWGVGEVVSVSYKDTFLYGNYVHEPDSPATTTPLRVLAEEAEADDGGEWMSR
ncbi:unnamed protein product, partial [Phaeothamnion confervicola]